MMEYMLRYKISTLSLMLYGSVKLGSTLGELRLNLSRLSSTWLNSETVDMTDFCEFNHHYVIRIEGSRGGGIGIFIK